MRKAMIVEWKNREWMMREENVPTSGRVVHDVYILLSVEIFVPPGTVGKRSAITSRALEFPEGCFTEFYVGGNPP